MEAQVSVIMKAQEIRSPYGEEFRGFRLLIAHPNLAGQAFGRSVPSFNKPFLITIFGDYEDEEHLFSAIALVTRSLTTNGWKPKLLKREEKLPTSPKIDLKALEAEVELWRKRVEQMESKND